MSRKTVSLCAAIGLFFAMSTAAALGDEAADRMARALFFAAENDYKAGNFDKALEALGDAEERLGGTNPTLLSLRVKTLYDKEDYPAAKEALDRFFEFDARPEVSMQMARYLPLIDEKLEALAARDAALEQAVLQQYATFDKMLTDGESVLELRGSEGHASSIVATPRGHFTVATNYRLEEYPYSAGRLVRVGSQNTVLWERPILNGRGQGVVPKALAAMPRGGYAVLGYVSAHEKDGGDHIWVGRYSEHDELIWQHSFGERYEPHPMTDTNAEPNGVIHRLKLAALPDGRLAFATTLSTREDGKRNNHAWIGCFDKDGNLDWQVARRNIGDVYDIAVIGDNRLAVVGMINGETLWTARRTEGGGYDTKPGDGWVAVFEDRGENVWEKVFASDNTEIDEWLTVVTATQNGGMIVAGGRQKGIPNRYELTTWMLGLTPDGDIAWETIDPDKGKAEDVALSSKGGFVVAAGLKFGVADTRFSLSRYGDDGRFEATIPQAYRLEEISMLPTGVLAGVGRRFDYETSKPIGPPTMLLTCELTCGGGRSAESASGSGSVQ